MLFLNVLSILKLTLINIKIFQENWKKAVTQNTMKDKAKHLNTK